MWNIRAPQAVEADITNRSWLSNQHCYADSVESHASQGFVKCQKVNPATLACFLSFFEAAQILLLNIGPHAHRDGGLVISALANL